MAFMFYNHKNKHRKWSFCLQFRKIKRNIEEERKEQRRCKGRVIKFNKRKRWWGYDLGEIGESVKKLESPITIIKYYEDTIKNNNVDTKQGQSLKKFKNFEQIFEAMGLSKLTT